ncbi:MULTISPECIES: flagellin [Clostridium]|uniref:flagellin N-terminal helical domain-containing protein n=1 Tax=Clostridium TaxID=1485 RepID=UPI00082596F6|nr:MULTISPECIES: flagellin [Clostridium]PJI09860.1 flagellin [Clostridium sp. CT7]
MRINHNIYSLKIFKNYRRAIAGQNVASRNLSSGIKVNNAADNPYAIDKDEKFNMQLRGLQKVSQNSQDTVSLLQTAEGGIDGISSMANRIRELALQAANGTSNDNNRADSQLEVSQLIDGINNLAKSTNINNVSLLDSDNPNALQCLVGYNAGEAITVPTFDFKTDNLTDASGNKLTDVNISTYAGAKTAINVVDAVLSKIDDARGQYGALENRFNSTVANTDILNSQIQSADSDVMDVDVAGELLEYSKQSIIVQAGTAMMAQANKFPQDVLNILKNVK